jgi:hypothetical protein|tara:strand:+ start:1727 stop:1942 length:216 start_codon:yes stop_codon:yes gene_type:complete
MNKYYGVYEITIELHEDNLEAAKKYFCRIVDDLSVSRGGGERPISVFDTRLTKVGEWEDVNPSIDGREYYE